MSDNSHRAWTNCSNDVGIGWDSEYDDYDDRLGAERREEEEEEWVEWEGRGYEEEPYAAKGGKFDAEAQMDKSTDETEQSSGSKSTGTTSVDDTRGGRNWKRWIAIFIALAIIIVGAAVGVYMATNNTDENEVQQQTKSTDTLQENMDESTEESTVSPTPSATFDPTTESSSAKSPITTIIEEDLQEDDLLVSLPRCVKKNSKPYVLGVLRTDGAEIDQATKLMITKTGPQGARSMVNEGLMKDILDRTEKGDPIYLCLRSRHKMCYTASLSDDMPVGVEWFVRPYYNEDKTIARGFGEQTCDFVAQGRADPICPSTCSI